MKYIKADVKNLIMVSLKKKKKRILQLCGGNIGESQPSGLEFFLEEERSLLFKLMEQRYAHFAAVVLVQHE